jgi:hypothetical protein
VKDVVAQVVQFALSPIVAAGFMWRLGRAAWSYGADRAETFGEWMDDD